MQVLRVANASEHFNPAGTPSKVLFKSLSLVLLRSILIHLQFYSQNHSLFLPWMKFRPWGLIELFAVADSH